jgi:hypothetical protein
MIGCNKDDDIFDVLNKIKKEAVLVALSNVMNDAYNRRFHNITDMNSINMLLERIYQVYWEPIQYEKEYQHDSGLESVSIEYDDSLERTKDEIKKLQSYMDSVYSSDFDRSASKDQINDMIRESIEILYKRIESD